MEFIAKNKAKAIKKAIKTLGVDKNELIINEMEIGKKRVGLIFSKKEVKINVLFKNKEGIEEILEVENESLTRETVEFIVKLYEFLGVEVVCETKLISDANELRIDIKTDNASMAIGSKGINIDSIQMLSNIIANKELSKKEKFDAVINRGMKVILDCENYRKEKEEYLSGFCLKIINDLKNNKGSFLLKDISIYEKRVIYSIVSNYKEIRIKNFGDDFYSDLKLYYQEQGGK